MKFLKAKISMQYSVFSIQSLKKEKGIIIAFLITLLAFSSSFAQFEIPKKPDIQTSVYDYANLLSPAEKSSLEEKLIKYSDTTTTQIVVAIINSTNGEEIKYLGAQWGHAWGI